MSSIQTASIARKSLYSIVSVVMLLSGLTATAADVQEDTRPLTGKRPIFGYGFFEDKSIDELVEQWGSDNPGLRNTSALETARRIWQSEDPVETLKSLLPRMEAALKSDNPNERRAVADVVYGLGRAGGKYMVLRVKLSDEEKLEGYASMRKEMGVLLPAVCANIKDDPHVWARAGAVDLAARIIAPYNKPADGLYEKHARIVRPLLLIRAQDEDRFMQQAAARALDAIGIDGLKPADVITTMSLLLDTQVNASCQLALKVLSQLDPEDLAEISQMMMDTMASDIVDGGVKVGITAAELLLQSRPPETAAAVIDYVTRDRHGNGMRFTELFPLIPQFTDDELRSAIPELTRLALMLEVNGRRDMARARGAISKLEKKDALKPDEKVALDNARKLIAKPSHTWVLELFDRIGEPRPKVGVDVTGPNPEKTAKITTPPWIPENVDSRVPLAKTDGLFGSRAMDELPGKKGKTLGIDSRAFSTEEPEANCRFLSIQDPTPQVSLRRPLGPTGILGTSSERRIFVVGTQPGSPAHEKIFANDWILGVNGHYFTSEPRVGMGWAIEESEGRKNGEMTLKVLREGKPMDVTIKLQPLGRHVDTWPYGCRKSDKILENLCEFTVRHDAKWVIPGSLLLLASGDEKYMPKIRQEVYEIEEKGPATSNWFTSYRLLLLSEYYQRTGDANILPAITKFAERLTSGQTYHGGYLHNTSYYNEWKDASKVGYGEMNMAGAPSLVSLILANECGVEMNNTAFKKSIDYFKIFSGRGHVPYGAHAPYIESAETGGKTVAISVGFDLLGRGDIAKPFVTMSGSAYEHMWNGYHGGSYWNATWRPLCVARDTTASFQRLTKHNFWYYNLARHWNGGMTAPVRGAADFINNHTPGQVMCFGMMYALPRKAIRLTGAPRSVFTKIEALGMQDLKNVYDARDDKALKAQVKALQSKGGMTAEKSAALDALLTAAETRVRIEKLELDQLKAALKSKDCYNANRMIAAMTKAGVPVPSDLIEAMTDEHEAEIEQGELYNSIMGNLVSGPTTFSSGDCKQLAEIAAATGYYAEQAKKAMADYAVPADGKWKASQMQEAKATAKEDIGKLFYLLSPSMDEIKTFRMKSWMTDVDAPHPVDDLQANPDLKGWYAMDYDDSHWPAEIGPFLIQEKRGNEREGHVLQRFQFVAKHVTEIDGLYLKARLGPRNFRGTLYLNGEALLEFRQTPCPRGRSRGHRNLGHSTAYIKLPPAAKTLIKDGRNVLALRADVPPNSSWSHAWVRMVDVGLGATKLGGGSWSYGPLVAGE